MQLAGTTSCNPCLPLARRRWPQPQAVCHALPPCAAGLDHLWRLALEADQGKVAAEAACTIVQLTLQLGPRLVEDQASVRAGTIKCAPSAPHSPGLAGCGTAASNALAAARSADASWPASNAAHLPHCLWPGRRLLEKLGEADAGLRAARRAQPPQEAAVERHGVHASRCLRLLQELVDKCQVGLQPGLPACASPPALRHPLCCRSGYDEMPSKNSCCHGILYHLSVSIKLSDEVETSMRTL